MKPAHEIDRFVFEELEQRILFSADVAAIAPAVTHPDVTPLELPQYQGPVIPEQLRSSSDGSEQAATVRHEVVFIDGAVDDARQLAEELGSQQDSSRVLSVFLLDPTLDGVAQISSVLAGLQDINGIHIISHGSDGQLQLGSTLLNDSSLLQNALAISGWGASLATGGDILLYGCDVAQTEAGQQFVDRIGKLTGADMAASNDLTGSSVRQGDWTLEYSAQHVETATVADSTTQLAYGGILGVFTVTSLADSGPGTLREAITNANSTAGRDTILFGTGAGTISLSSLLPTVTEEVVIDARSATGYAGKPLIEIKGNGLNGSGLVFAASNSYLYGVAITNFGGNGVDVLAGADNFLLQSNYIGLRTDGTTALGNGGDGINIAGSYALIGGSAAQARNVISANTGNGLGAQTGATNLRIFGNYFGTDASGMADRGNVGNGAAFASANNFIGDTSAGSGNLFSGNGQNGILLTSTAAGSTILGNWVGLDSSGTGALGNDGMGVWINGASNVTVGGTAAGVGNRISFNGAQGIAVGSGATGVAIQGNLYQGNGALAIDLSANGVTANDTGDGDTGPNNLQNFPVISAVQTNKNLTYIQGTLNSTASRTFRLEIYANTTRDPSGYGEGQILVGSGTVTTNASGNATFNISYTVGGPDFMWYTATATDTTSKDTSEFSLAVQATILNAAPTGTDKTITSNEDTAYTFTVADFGFTDPGNNTPNNFTFVRIFTPPTNGTLTNNGVAVAAGNIIPVNAISTGKLVYTPAANASGNGYASIGFAVRDDGGTANGGLDTDTTTHTLTFNISAVNDAPVLTTTAPVTQYIENAAAVVVDAGITLTDTDSTTMSSALISITGNFQLYDFLSIVINAGTMGDITQELSIDPSLVKLVSQSGTATLAQWQAALRAVSFYSTSDKPDPGARTIRFSINDGTATSNFATKQLVITAVNDAPSGASNSISVPESVGYTFAASEFGFSDATDGGANGFLSLLISTIPSTGSLTYNGTAVSAGQSVLKADIDAGKLVYRYSGIVHPPATSASASFTFRVRDDGGTSNGGIDTDPTARTMAITITPVNHAPQGADKTVTILESTAYTFAGADFGFSDPDNSPANTLAGVLITTLPAAGTLTVNGTGVVAGSEVSAADIAAGRLVYTPVTNANGPAAASFSFRVRDNGGTASNGVDTDPVTRTMTFDITAVNTAPGLANSPGTQTYVENSPALVIDPGITVSDADNTTLASATVRFVSGYSNGQDILALVTNATMGNITASWDAGTALLSLSSAGSTATLAQWQAALRAVTYLNSSENPVAGNRLIRFQISDGSLSSSAVYQSVAVAPVNDAPVLSTSPGSLNYVENAAALTIDPNITISDVDNSTFASATVRISSGFVAGQDVLGLVANGATMGNISASYNSATGVLVLNSAGNTAGTAQWHAALRAVTYSNTSDNPSTASRTVSFTLNDSSADSNATTQTISITAVNDAPAGANNAITIAETAAHTFAASEFGFSDAADGGAHNFIALLITTIPSTGTLSYNGTAVGAGQSVLKSDIDAGKLVYAYSGTISPPVSSASASFTFRVRDDGGTGNGGVDTDPTARTMVITITPVNHAPQGADNTITILESTAYTFAIADFGFSDPDNNPANSLAAVRITSLPAPGTGTLTYNGNGFFAGSEIIAADIAAGFLVYTPETNANGMAAASFSFQLRDNGGTANGGVDLDPVMRTLTFDITAVNTAPLLTNASGTQTFVENSPAQVVDPGITVDDVDNTTLASATVRFASGYSNGQDILALLTDATMGNISASWNAGTAALTLSSAGSSATLAQWQAALRAVTFVNTSDNPAAGNRVIRFQVNDGSLNSNAVFQTITVAPVNDAPLLTTSPGSLNYVENAAPLTIDPNITISDVDNSTFASATVRISAGFVAGQDWLIMIPDGATMGNIAANYDSGTGVLTLSSAGNSANTAQWQAALRAVTYRNGSDNPSTASRTVSFTLHDGAADSNTTTQNVSVTAVNDAPSGADNTVTMAETAPHTFVASEFGFSDATDGGAHAFYTVRITTLPATGSLTYDGLALGAGSTISKSNIDAGKLVFVYSGSITPPATSATASFTFQLRDDGGTDNGGVDTDPIARTMTITITPVNHAPQGADNTITILESTAHTFAGTDFGFSDPGNSPANTLAGVLIVTLPAAGTGTLTINGAGVLAGSEVSAADIAAGRLVYTPVTNANGTAVASFSFRVRDNGGTASNGVDTDSVTRTMTFDITAVNTAPVLANSPGTQTYVENSPALVIDSGITVSDADNTTLVSATVRFASGYNNGQDLLALVTDATMGNIAVSWDAGTATLALSSAGSSATLAQWQAALRAVTFVNTSNDPVAGAREIRFWINDGSLNSNAVFQIISVAPLNDAPVLATSPGSLNFVEHGAALTIDPALAITDADNTTLSSASVRFTMGYSMGQDVLGLVTDGSMGNITASWDAGTAALTLSSAGSTATLAQWQAALRAVTFSNASSDLTPGNRVIRFQVSDGSADSNAVTQTITVTPVNDAPVLNTSGGISAYLENNPGLVIDAGLSISDVDNATLSSATVSITGGFAGAQDVLAFANGGSATMGNITASYDASIGLLTLTSAGAQATVAQWQAALRAVTYSNTSDAPDVGNRTILFLVSDGSLGSSQAYKTVSVTAVNDAPVLSVSPGAAAYVENAAALVIDPGLTLADPDNGTLTRATVSIAGNFFASQDTLAFANTGSAAMGNITASWNAVTGVLSLDSAGATATVAQWQTALRAVTYANRSESPDPASRTISFQVSDGSLTSAAAGRTVIVTPVNDAPAGKPFTVTINEDTAHTFRAGDFGFTDAADGNQLSHIVFTTLPASGAIMVNGSAVAAGFSVSLASLNAGQVVYAPAANFNGSVTFTFQVRDDGGTAHGGIDLDATPRLATFNILTVNDGPTATPAKLVLADNKPHVFTVADFGFADAADTPANALLSVTIASLPANGSLTLDGKAIQAGTVVLRSDIEAGKLVFTAPTSGNTRGLFEFTFLVRDDGGTLRGGIDTDTMARVMRLELPVLTLADSGFVTLPVQGATTQQPEQPGDSAAAQAAASTAASAAASAAAAGAGSRSTSTSSAESREADEARRRVILPATAGSRSLAIEVDSSVIRANIVRYLGDNANATAAQLAANMGANPSESESGSVFRQTLVVVETPVDRRTNLLALQKNGSSGESSLGAIMPAPPSPEESRQELSNLRATAHRIETAIAVSALGTIWVVARKAALVASLLSTVPAWMRLDPLPILGGDEDEDDLLEQEDEETAQADSVEHLFTVADKEAGAGKETRPQ